MPPISAWPLLAPAKHRIVLEGVISRLDAQEPRRQRTPDRVRRAVVGTPSAVGAGVEVEHVLPGEVLELLHAERFHLIKLLVADTPAHRLHGSAVQFREEHIEQRSLHVELDSERPVAQQEVKGEDIDDVRAKVQTPKCQRATLNQGHPAATTAAKESAETRALRLAEPESQPGWPQTGSRRTSAGRSTPTGRWHQPGVPCRTFPELRNALA